MNRGQRICSPPHSPSATLATLFFSENLIFNACGIEVVFAGVDAGTKSYKIVWFESPDKLRFEELPTENVKKSPKLFVKKLEDLNADVYAGLSGYGLPIKHFSEITEFEIKLMTLTFEKKESVGLRKLVNLISKSELNFYTIPAVIHLNTVPAYRKFFRIDMGTYDKLCTALSIVYDYGMKNMVVVDAGYGYTAFMAIENGCIVDGFGGTSFLPTYRSSGCIDAEVAYLLGKFEKDLIKTGLRNFFEEDVAFKAYIENVLKGVNAIKVSIKDIDNIIVSGRFAKKIGDATNYKIYEKNKFASAFGAAIVACAISKKIRKIRELTERAGVFSAQGTVLDYLPDKVREIVIKKLLKNRKF